MNSLTVIVMPCDDGKQQMSGKTGYRKWWWLLYSLRSAGYLAIACWIRGIRANEKCVKSVKTWKNGQKYVQIPWKNGQNIVLLSWKNGQNASV